MSTWLPKVEDVAAIIPERTDQTTGTFTARTRPSFDHVSSIIEAQRSQLVGEVGAFNPTRIINPEADPDDRVSLGDLARDAVALGAASQIEDRYFPEQQTGQFAGLDSTPSQHLYARYRRAVELLKNQADKDRDEQPFTGSVAMTHASRRTGPHDVPRVASARRRP